MRKTAFADGEYYHIYNRGVDKRDIFMNQLDFGRFLQSMDEFNAEDPIGSIYENAFLKDLAKDKTKKKKLVNIICYCLNPNHYHFILEQLMDRGVEKFMHRLGGGYTKYFNSKHQRNGSLFQGPFKAIHIDSNKYLLHLSAYTNLNFKVHRLGSLASKWRSSWDEYQNRRSNFGLCNKDIILEQFKNRTEYKQFAESSLEDILKRKDALKEVADLLLE